MTKHVRRFCSVECICISHKIHLDGIWQAAIEEESTPEFLEELTEKGQSAGVRMFNLLRKECGEAEASFWAKVTHCFKKEK